MHEHHGCVKMRTLFSFFRRFSCNPTISVGSDWFVMTINQSYLISCQHVCLFSKFPSVSGLPSWLRWPSWITDMSSYIIFIYRLASIYRASVNRKSDLRLSERFKLLRWRAKPFTAEPSPPLCFGVEYLRLKPLRGVRSPPAEVRLRPRRRGAPSGGLMKPIYIFSSPVMFLVLILFWMFFKWFLISYELNVIGDEPQTIVPALCAIGYNP